MRSPPLLPAGFIFGEKTTCDGAAPKEVTVFSLGLVALSGAAPRSSSATSLGLRRPSELAELGA